MRDLPCEKPLEPAGVKPIKILCGHCRQALEIPAEHVAKKVQCPSCRNVFVAQIVASEPDRNEAIVDAELIPITPPAQLLSPEEQRGQSQPLAERSAIRSGRPGVATKAKSSKGLLVALGIGGGVLVLALIVAGFVGYWMLHNNAVADDTWKEFVSPDKSFKVLMPGEPTMKQQTVAGLPEAMIMYVVDLGNRAYFVSHADFSREEAGRVAIKDRFAAMRDAMVGRKPGSKLLSEKDIDCNGSPSQSWS